MVKPSPEEDIRRQPAPARHDDWTPCTPPQGQGATGLEVPPLAGDLRPQHLTQTAMTLVRVDDWG